MYWADYFADTTHLTTFQHGCYMLLIGAYWRRGGPLPNDDRFLAQACRTTLDKWRGRAKISVAAMFTGEGDWLRHKRIDLEILKSSERLDSARANGRAGGLAKSKLTTITTTTTKEESKREGSPLAPLASNGKGEVHLKPKGSRLPDDWMPSESEVSFARERGFGDGQIADMTISMRNHFCAGPGRNKTYTSWSRCWQNWVIRENPKTSKPVLDFSNI